MNGQVVRCPGCDKQNRISPRPGKEGVWKCAKCGTALRATGHLRRIPPPLALAIIGLLIAILVLPVALLMIPTTRDEIHWRWASYADSGPSRTPIPTHRGQRSGDRGQFLTVVQA